MKLKLDQTYIHSGKFYGPGETEVSDEVGKDLQARMETGKAATPLQPPTDSTTAGAQHPDDGATKDGGSSDGEDLSALNVADLKSARRPRASKATR